MAKHTPTPWSVKHFKGTIDRNESYPVIVPGYEHYRSGWQVPANLYGTHPERIEADAAYIIRCVNAHEKLVAALDAILAVDNSDDKYGEPNDAETAFIEDAVEMRSIAKTALA